MFYNTDNNDTGTMWEVGYADRSYTPALNSLINEFYTDDNYDRLKSLVARYLNKRLPFKSLINLYVNHLSLSGYTNDDFYKLYLELLFSNDITIDHPHISLVIPYQSLNNQSNNSSLLKSSMDLYIKLLSITPYIKLYDSKNYYNLITHNSNNDHLAIFNIDDRDPYVSRALGHRYFNNDKIPSSYTYSDHDYGVNIMLLHSISGHFTNKDDLVNAVEECVNSCEVISYTDYIRNTKDFE